MSGTTSTGACRLLLLVAAVGWHLAAASLYFEDGYDHHYTYSSESDMLGLHNVTTIMKLRIRCVNRTADGGSLNLLQLDSFVQHAEHGYYEICGTSSMYIHRGSAEVDKHDADNPMKWDLSRKLFFTVGDEGVVTIVHYHPEEDEEVLSLKKVLAGTLSANIKNQQGNNWRFKSYETDHAGHLEHEYEGAKTTDGIKIIRRHRSTERVHRQHDKTMLFDTYGTPHFIESFDNITLLSPEPQEKRKAMDGEQEIPDFETGEFPSIGTTSSSKLKLTVKRHHGEPAALTIDMIQDTIRVKPKTPEKVSLVDIEDEIQDLLKCIHSHTEAYDRNRTECMSSVRRLIYSLHKDDFIALGRDALTRRCDDNATLCIDERELLLDIIGSEGSPEAQQLIVDLVLKQPNVTEDDLQRCLIHCVVLSHPIPDLVDEIEKLCFDGTEKLRGITAMATTQRRACLAQGTLGKALHTKNVTESDRLVQALEDWLQPHNQSEAMRIIKPRLRRSITEDDEGASAHVETKMILLHSLGNAGKQRSLGHILSYMEPGVGVPTWRRAAINSLRHFTCNESAAALVTSAVYDDNDLVRKTALQVFGKHPLSKENVVDHENILLSKRYTYPIVARMRRSVLDDLLSFHIATPSKQWRKDLGSSKIGASFGLHTKNLLDLKMGILSGHFAIDVDNGAFAEAHVGLINLQVDIFRAKICFGGHIEYNLNPLKDFGINSLQDLVHIFDKIVGLIVTPIIDAINTFKKIVDVIKKNGPANFVNELVITVKDLPHILLEAPQKIREFVEYAFTATGSVVIEEIKHIAQSIRHLIDSVQQDVLKFYNDIVDAVTMALPYIGKKIVGAFKLIRDAFEEILKNPMQAITYMWRAVTQIKMAVTMIVDVKNRIIESCMFLKGRASEWLNSVKEIPKLLLRMTAAFGKLSRSIQERVPKLENTGVYSNGVQTLENNGRALENKWDGVVSHLQPMLKAIAPFMDLFQSVMKLIKDTKIAYMEIKNAIQIGKSLVQRVFGPKFSSKFPTERMKASSDCPAGVWPTTTGDHYSADGVDLTVNAGQSIVAPVDGIIKTHRDDNKIVIQPTDPEFESFEIIIQNIKALPNVDKERIHAGEDIGVVTSAPVCGGTFIHVAVRQAEEADLPDDQYDYVDPSPFLDKLMPIPKWHQDCNEYEFRLIGYTTDAGNSGGKPKSLKGKLKRLGKPAVKELMDKLHPPNLPAAHSTNTHHSSPAKLLKGFKNNLKNSLKSQTKQFMNLFKTGLFGKNGPKMPNILEIVDLSGRTLEWILGQLEVGSTSHTALTKAISDLCGAMHAVPQGNPVTLGLSYLRKVAEDNGVPESVGDVVDLAGSLLAAPEKLCPLFKGAIASAYGHMCTAHSDCLGISCSVAVILEKIHYVKLDVAASVDGSIKLTINNNDIQLHADGREYELELGEPIFGMTLTLLARSTIADGTIQLDAEAKICNKILLTCMEPVEILTEIRFNISAVPLVRTRRDSGLASCVAGMTIPQFITSVGEFGLLSRSITDVLQNVRELVVDELLKEAEDKIGDIVQEVKDKLDVCIDGHIPPVNFNLKIFDTDDLPIPMTFPVGPIVIGFRFRADGPIGLGFDLKICILSMKIKAVLIPNAGVKFTGEINVNLALVRGGIGISGLIVETQFPITAELSFAKFPIRLSAKMDMVLIPLSLRLFAFADVFLLFKYGRVFEANLWTYSTPAIRVNIFTLPSGEDDTSPPEAKPRTVSAISKRESRPDGCIVKQIAGRGPDDTAFSLEFHAEDPTSDISMSYAVGTHIGGTDVVGWTEMGGSSILAPSNMPGGVPLYWTVKAKNSQGLALTTQCSLATYDNTIPDGRVEHSYKYSSHPSQLSASVVVFEDSPLQDTHFKSVGYSAGKYGAELVNWSPVQLGHSTDRTGVTGVLKHFNVPREGKLIAYILQTQKVSTPDQCAQRCITFGARCVSFDYEKHSETCDLHDVVQGANAFLRISGTYSNYERLGTGYNTLIEYTDLPLTHGTTYFVNTQVTNVLGYVAYLVGDGTMVDFSPPQPGPISNPVSDILRADGCTAAVTQRCIHVTSRDNHRIIVDGTGSATVFNGHEPLLDELYTLTNHYVSANWNGFHDDESGLWGFTWAVGTTICGTNVLQYTDPYTHLSSKKFWTDSGFHKGIHLADGSYYVTVQALNGAELGGSLVTTVCHSTPFIVDTSPPLFKGVTDIIYDEDFDLIALYYDAEDDLSKIAKAEFGLGKTKYDVQLKSYSLHAAMTREDPFLSLEDLGLKEGIPAWIRIRVTNNVDLFTAGHGDEPILIDRSPPLAGNVLDGSVLQHDLEFQSDNTQICAQWRDFYDPESGIDRFLWGVGSRAGDDDIVKLHNMTHYEKSGCSPASLEHNHTYYSTVYSYNNALNSKANISMSDGVLVDLTPPISGHVTDGNIGEPDMEFTSETVSKHCHWDGYYDPESGIDRYIVDVYINNEQKGSFNVEENKEFHDHTVSLEHLDNVYFNVHGINGADLEIASQSDGFRVDHTAPIMTEIYDNKDGYLFQRENNSMHVGWNFQDEESGIKEYRTVIYESKFGVKQTVWPPSNLYNVTKPESSFSAKVNTVVDQLDLTNGATYSVHVTAMNGAKLSTSHESPGVTVDNSPPNEPDVHIGLPKDEEQIEGGNILHDDENAIRVSWSGRDAESGITNFLVAVGTTKDPTQLTDFVDYGEATTAYIQNIHFQTTNKSGILYVVSVKAVNGAGLESAPGRSGTIYVQKANVPGIVFDGRNIYKDEMYSDNYDSIAASFYGFESESCNIVGYEWGIGTEEYGTDVLTFTNYGLVMENNTHGFAQIHTDIYEDTAYYVTIRAVTGCHNGYIVSSSDGITIDSTAPEIVYDMSDNDTDAVLYDDVIYQANSDVLTLLSNVTDTQHVSTVQWALGSLPLEDDIHAYTGDYRALSHSVHFVPGKSIFLTTNSSDAAGNLNTTSSLAIIADITPPVVRMLSCTKYVSVRKSLLTCQWDKLEEVESPVETLTISIGTQPQMGDILDKYVVAHGLRKFTRDLVSYIRMYQNNTIIYVDMSVTNIVGHRNDYEVAVIVDTTVPTVGSVEVVTRTTDAFPLGHQECQWASSYLELAVTNLLDTESGIDTDRFEVCVGSVPFGSDVLPLTAVRKMENGIFFVNGFRLSSGSAFHATLRSYNQAGLFIDTTSPRVVVSDNPRLSVSDGADVDDIDFQSVTNVIQGHWKYSDLCPIKHAYWQIQDIVGNILVPFREIPGAASEFYNDEVKLENGVKYISVIKTIDALARTKLTRSDGVSVRIQPPTPGHVRDGLEEDLNYQFSTTEISANWDVFGDAAADPTQQIHHYEVAIGNDRRYSRTRSNVHYFENVGLNRSYTFEHLNLTAKIVKYYATVRGVSMAGAFAEGYSNGIRVGFRGTIIHGDIYSNIFQSSVDTIVFSWNGFYSDIGIIQYKAAISSNDNFLTNDTVDCKLIAHNESMFDVSPLNNAGLDEYITISNLKLIQNEMYYPTVIAEDESGMCTAVTGSPIKVDTTPPISGILFVNELSNSSILFATSASQLTVRWGGFEDPESGIREVLVNLFECTSCATTRSSSVGCVTIAESLVINDMTVTLYELELDTDKTYFVRIVVKNRAGLNVTIFSPTILQDQSKPLLGTVKIASNWNNMDTFQSSTNAIQGLIAIAPTQTTYECAQDIKYFPQAGKYEWDRFRDDFSSDFQTINETGAYLGVGYNADLSGITKSGIRDKIMELHTGNYSVHIKAAHGTNIITTFAFMTDSAAIPFTIDNKPADQQFDWGSFMNVSGLVAPGNDTIDGRNTTGEYTMTTLSPELFNDTNYTKPVQQNTTLRNTDFAFGIHILGYKINENIEWHHLFWARSRFASINEWFRMDSDPTHSQNIYTFNVKQSQSTLDSYLDISLMVNGHEVVTTSGFKFPTSFKLAVLTWNEDNYMPPIDDLYHPFYTDTTVSSIYVPDTRVKPCRHGRGFYDGESGIKEIWTGVSDSETSIGNVSPLRLAYKFCFPCQEPCVDLCKTPCDGRKPANNFEILPLTVNGLTLKSVDIDDPCMNISSGIKCNGTSYYLNVKAVNFAGSSNVAYSNAIQVDVTPPACSYVKCLDPEYSEDEPTSHIGSSSTIGAYWNCSEDVGLIQYYTVAVTTAANGSVLLGTRNIGDKAKVRLNLGNGTFIDGHDYMLHLTAVNTAGLEFMANCSVHVNLYPPDIGNSSSGPLYASASTADDPAAVTAYQNRMGVSWSDGPSDTEFYEWQLGTGPENDDIFPPVKVGVNSSGSAAIMGGKLHLNSRSTNTSVLEFYNMKNVTTEDMERRRQASAREKEFFYMEPGRCVYQILYAIGYSHLKQKLTTKPVCVKRSGDIQIKKRKGTHIISKQRQSSVWHAGKTTDADIAVQLNVIDGDVQVGSITPEDKQMDYGSAASSDFLPYITDPQTTGAQTTRMLRNRITTFCNVSFYVSPSPVAVFETMIVNITVPPGCGKDADFQPALIYWDVDIQRWIHNDEGCLSYLTAMMVADVYSSQLCVPTSHPGKRTTTHTMSKPRHMELVRISRAFPNHAPGITTDAIQTKEDDFVPVTIDTYDRENDKLMFEIVSQPAHATCTISAIGVLNCTLEDDFYGDDAIVVRITELGLPPHEEALSSTKTIQIHVSGDPDSTDRFYIDPNGRIYHNNRPRLANTITIEANTTGSMFAGTIILADKDGGESFTPINKFVGLENSSYMLTDVSVSDIPNRKLISARYRTLKAYNIDIQFSPDTHGKISFSFISQTADGMYTPSVSLEVYILLKPCVHGWCSHATKPHGCEDINRAHTFADFYCACEPGYSGEWCEVDIDECAPAPCALMFDCEDLVNGYNCNINLPKLMAILVCSVIAVAGAVFLIYRLVKRWKYNKVGQSRISLMNDNFNPTIGPLDEDISRPLTQASIYLDSQPPLDTNIAGKSRRWPKTPDGESDDVELDDIPTMSMFTAGPGLKLPPHHFLQNKVRLVDTHPASSKNGETSAKRQEDASGVGHVTALSPGSPEPAREDSASMTGVSLHDGNSRSPSRMTDIEV